MSHLSRYFLTILIISAAAANAEDFTRLGGDLTSTFSGPAAIQVFAPNVVSPERRALQVSGFAPFHKSWSAQEGLGPRFVNSSCGGCHVQSGRGALRFHSQLSGGSAVIKVAWRDKNNQAKIGPVLQNNSVTGERFHDIRLSWQEIDGRYPDGTPYTLKKPKLRFKVDGAQFREVLSSLRMSPALIGVGLLEAIPQEAIEALADPQDLDGDGISGSPNYSVNIRNGEIAIGRFGYKAGQPTVEQQSAAALGNEMGVSNSLFPHSLDGPLEMSDETLEQIVIYQTLGGVPQAREQTDAFVKEGSRLFFEVGCEACHTATHLTSSSADPELANQTIHPFTDMLLHDMGAGLADKLAEGSAKGSEWRTAPLWGLGYSKTLSDVGQRYMHDGRARTIEQAILWHGGESKALRDAFKNLSKIQRMALIKFLESL